LAYEERLACVDVERESPYAELRQTAELLNDVFSAHYADMRIAPACRMRFDGLLELKRHLDGVTVLDLKEVTHVDLEVVHFLGCCVQEGIELRNCARYIREWILREQGRQTDA